MMSSESDAFRVPLHTWDPGRRLAFDVRYAAAIELDLPLADATPELQHEWDLPVLHQARMQADICITRGTKELDSIKNLGRRLLDADIISRNRRLQNRINKFSNRLDSILSSGFDRPPSDVHGIFESIRQFVSRQYEQYCGNQWSAPTALIEFGYRLASGGLPSVDGRCRFADTCAPISIIKLIIKDGRLDWNRVARLPYVFMHELMCHAFQGSIGIDPNGRTDADENCAWSEGWMDTVAMFAVEDWIRDHDGPPDWIKARSQEIRDATVLAHRSRYNSKARIKREVLCRRQAAQRAVGRLRHELNGSEKNGNGLRSGYEFLLCFSLIFNARNLSAITRNSVVQDISLALDASSRPADLDEVFYVIHEFCDTEDVKAFQQDLCRLRSAA